MSLARNLSSLSFEYSSTNLCVPPARDPLFHRLFHCNDSSQEASIKLAVVDCYDEIQRKVGHEIRIRIDNSTTAALEPGRHGCQEKHDLEGSRLSPPLISLLVAVLHFARLETFLHVVSG